VRLSSPLGTVAHVTCFVLVGGWRGSGNTTLARALAREL
jgi:Flp pilus assembly CpaF family ATPase